MRLDQREIARYLGAAGKPLWPEAAAWARDCQRELEGTVTPRLLGRRLSLSLFAGESRDLDWHLRHCTQGVLFAVTLGAETDRLLRRPAAPTGGRGIPDTPLQSGVWGLEPGGAGPGFGPAPGPQADRADPHGRGNAGAGEIHHRPGGHQ